jgi:hypothetical protein
VLSWGAGRRLGATLCAAVLFVGAAACGGDDGGDAAPTTSSTSSTSSSSSSSTTSSTTTSTTKAPATPEEEVEAAYLKSWDVYAKAVRDLDPSGLEEAFARDALATITNEVAELKAANTPVRVDVDHNYTVAITEDGKVAIVFDDLINRMVLLNGDTGEPLEEPDGKVLKRAYQLEVVEGAWKVVFRRAL